MSERTAPSLARLDDLLARLAALPASADREAVIEETEALRRAVAAFHMEAIRFRMYAVDRHIGSVPGSTDLRPIFEDVRHALETAGFHTRSHAAPGKG